MINIKRTSIGHYRDSVRTSGEVLAVFIREIDIIFNLVCFIDAKVHLFLIR